MTRRTFQLAAIAILCAALSPAMAQMRTAPPGAYPLIKGSPGEPGAARGAWLDRYDPFSGSVSGRGRPSAAWVSQLQPLIRLVRESPALADLRGYYPQLSVEVDEAAQPVAEARLFITFWPPRGVVAEPSVADPAKRYRIKEEAGGPGIFTAYVNHMPRRTSGRVGDALLTEDWMQDEAGKFFQLPPAERTLAGFPVRGGYLFVSASGKPPLFLPVSEERALRAIIKSLQGEVRNLGEGQGVVNEQLAHFNSPEMKKIRRQVIEEAAAREKDPKRAAAARDKAERDDREQERQLRELAGRSVADNPVARRVASAIAGLEAKLAAMSPAQRRAPAYLRNNPDDAFGREIVGAGVAGSTPLMQYNAGFLDPKLPPHAIQLVVMRVASYFELQDRRMTPDRLPLPERLALAIAEQTDWRKVAALLK